MPQFDTASVAEVITPVKETGERAKWKGVFQAALDSAVQNHEALVVTLEPEDKPLTVRNRLHAAAKALGLEDKVEIRKVRKDKTNPDAPIRIMAYHLSDEEAARSAATSAE